MRFRRFVVLMAAAVFTVGCSKTHRAEPTPTTVAPTGLAVGRMHVTGGPGPKPVDQDLPGEVDVFRAAAFVTYPDHKSGFDSAPVQTVIADSNGRFRISLPAGTYRLRGDPDAMDMEINTQPFTIKAGQTTPVDMVIYTM